MKTTAEKHDISINGEIADGMLEYSNKQAAVNGNGASKSRVSAAHRSEIRRENDAKRSHRRSMRVLGRKSFSVFMSIVMVLGLTPLPAFGANGDLAGASFNGGLITAPIDEGEESTEGAAGSGASQSAEQASGEAKVIVTGKGNYTGKATGTFDINLPPKMLKAAVAKDVAAACKKLTDADPKGSTFSRLQLKVPKASKKSIKLSWKKVKKAAYYVLLGNLCGKGKKYAEVKTFKPSKKAFTVKRLASGAKLKPGRSYKFLLLAFNKAGKRVATSKTVHVYTTGKKMGNVRKVTLSKKRATLKVGKTLGLKAKVFKQKGKKLRQHRKVLFESSNKAVATVKAKTGVVKAKKKGTCFIYAYACDGKFTRCKVRVK